MNKQNIVQKTEAHIRRQCEHDTSGHDWWHIDRVRNLALRIGAEERADLFIVELGALLHDIADFKFHNGDDRAGGKAARKWLTSLGANELIIEKICHIVDNVSFKGLGVKSKMYSLEGKVVQDADRLDAIGAIGIARAFAYGGHKGRPLYIPGTKPSFHKTFSAYKKGENSSLLHFYEKLLHLKGLMNTKAGKKIAASRHRFLVEYIKEFHAEWDGKK